MLYLDILCPNCQYENRENAKFCENCGTKDEASASLDKARTISKELNHRRVLWQILAEATEIERERGDSEAAERLNAEAKEIVFYICERAPGELRESFVNQPEVKRILHPSVS